MAYTRTDWKSLPDTSTPINTSRLNNIEDGIYFDTNNLSTDEYSNSSTYAVGDYCIYNHKLYKCNTAILSGENFNSSKWTQTTITNELGNMFEDYSSQLVADTNNVSFAAAPQVLQRIGNMVFCRISFNLAREIKMGVTGRDTLFTVPQAIRPSTNCRFAYTSTYSAANVSVYMLASDGTIHIGGTSSANEKLGDTNAQCCIIGMWTI